MQRFLGAAEADMLLAEADAEGRQGAASPATAAIGGDPAAIIAPAADTLTGAMNCRQARGMLCATIARVRIIRSTIIQSERT